MTREQWEGVGSWQGPVQPHAGHLPFQSGRGLVHASQGAGDRAHLPAALPAGTQLPALWVLLFQTQFPRCSLEVGSGQVGVFVEALGHGQKAPVGDGSSWGKGPQLLHVPVRGAIFVSRLGRSGCGEATSWKIPLPRANEWFFARRVFVDFKSLNPG